MTFTIQLQPTGSLTCGHHCVAMITNRPISKIIQLIGHEKATFAKDLARVLELQGIKSDTKLKRVSKKRQLPELCILRYKWYDGRRHGHWVVHHNGQIFDPVLGQYPLTSMKKYFKNTNIVSYLEIFSEECQNCQKNSIGVYEEDGKRICRSCSDKLYFEYDITKL